MNADEIKFKTSSKFWLLDPSIPRIPSMNLRQLQHVNQKYRLPFVYTDSCLLVPSSQILVDTLIDSAGRCLGGGVIASRDLEWLSKGKNGNQPGDYIPPRTFLSKSKAPQSLLSSEWIALEYGLILKSPFGQLFGKKWDEISGIFKVRSQGNDWHIRFDSNWDESCASIHAQANKQGIQTILSIAKLVGVADAH